MSTRLPEVGGSPAKTSAGRNGVVLLQAYRPGQLPVAGVKSKKRGGSGRSRAARMALCPAVSAERWATLPSPVARVTGCVGSSSWRALRRVSPVVFSTRWFSRRAIQQSWTWARMRSSRWWKTGRRPRAPFMSRQPRSRVPQLSRRLVTRNRPLSRADVMITGVAPRYQAHRNFSGAPLRRSAAWRASQTAHRRALEELRRRDLCPKATSGLVGAGRTGRRVWAGQHAYGACAMARRLPHVTRRYGRVPSKVKLWITTSVTRQIAAAGPRATAPGTVTWTYASRPSPGTSRAAEPEHGRLQVPSSGGDPRRGTKDGHR